MSRILGMDLLAVEKIHLVLKPKAHQILMRNVPLRLYP
jgi:hypothetical protein